MTRSERVFARLLRIFPADFRARFGKDMADLFRDQLAAARADGRGAVARLWLRTVPSFVVAGLRERRESAARATGTGGPSMVEVLVADLRLTLRLLRRSPGFALTAVVVMSLGIGAVATIASAINAVVLRPLPGATEGHRLIGIERRSRDYTDGASASVDYYRFLQDRARTVAGIAAWNRVALSVAFDGQGHALLGNLVSGNYFSVLGARPALGRFFSPEEDRSPGTHPVVVVSHGFWERALGGDSTVIGRTLSVNGHPFTLIGVAEPGFRGVFTPLRTEAWVPLMMRGQLRPGQDAPDAATLWLFARLADGVSKDAARQELGALVAERADDPAEPAAYREYRYLRMTDLTGLPDDARRLFLGFMSLLLGAAFLVLIIASVNVASMLSARAIARRREMALRTALGAGRGRLIRQLLTESIVLFLLGAGGGVLVASVVTDAFERMPLPAGPAFALELSPDPRILVFSILLALLTGLAFGLAPALQGAQHDVTIRLRSDTAAGGRRRSGVASALIVGQLALSLVLLVAAGLFLRALQTGSRIDPGFRVDGVVMTALDPTAWGYDDGKGRAFYRAFRERLAALPGVTAVSATGVVPLGFASSGIRIRLDGQARTGPRDGIHVEVAAVDPGYFTVLELPLAAGREFETGDDGSAPPVMIINETLARRIAPDGQVLGATLTVGDRRMTIVGIARDAKYGSLGEVTPPFAYFPLDQWWRSDQTMLIRSTNEAAALAPAIAAALHAIDPSLPRPTITTLRREAGIVLLPQRVAATVTGALGLVGLLMATVGLYGIISFSANRRVREIGVRVALGASRRDVVSLIVRDGVRLAGAGVVVGLLLAAAVTRLLGRFLFDLSPFDPVTFAAMAALFIGVALLASYLPARRAATADPMTALRAD